MSFFFFYKAHIKNVKKKTSNSKNVKTVKKKTSLRRFSCLLTHTHMHPFVMIEAGAESLNRCCQIVFLYFRLYLSICYLFIFSCHSANQLILKYPKNNQEKKISNGIYLRAADGGSADRRSVVRIYGPCFCMVQAPATWLFTNTFCIGSPFAVV